MDLPQAFVRRTKLLLEDEYNLFEEALSEPSPISIRLNDKIDYEPSSKKVEWCKKGFYLQERPLFTADPLFHAGVYYVQEASSMFLYQLVQEYLAKESQIVLDLCAAPGGKSTLLSQVLSKNSLLVSNEISVSRANVLAENVIKWGNPHVIVTNNKPKDFSSLNGFFDGIVVDAPCSGEGMFRKDPDAVNEWSEQNVQMCAERQKEILSDIWDTLKPNGILIYSTCTYNEEENEHNVKWICENLGAVILKVNVSTYDGVIENNYGYRFYPHKVKGEGFFISILRKTDDIIDTNPKFKKRKDLKEKYSTELPFKLKNPSEYEIIRESNKVFAYNSAFINQYKTIKNNLRCVYSGVELGEIKGKDFIPSAAVALSKELDIDSINKIDVDYKTAINYLRREAIYLPDAGVGYNLISYKNQPLGWIKNVGKRWNNLYPNEWKIRMRL